MKLTSLFLIILFSSNLFAKEKKLNATLNEQHYWYDGPEKRILGVDLDLVAEEIEEVDTKQTKQNSQRQKRLRITTKTAFRKNQKMLPSSPVFRDQALAKGDMRALPGQVIVHFSEAWSLAKIKSWVASQKLSIHQQLDFGKNVFLLKTEMGLQSLEIANKLYETGDVLAAYPNWWKEMSKR